MIQLVPDLKSTIKCSNKTPNIVCGIIIQLLCKHFYDSNSILIDELKQYTWNPDEKKTKIWISKVTKFNLNNIQQRPMILIKRQTINIAEHTFNNLSNVTPKAEYIYERFLDCIYDIICIGTEDTFVELLLQEVDTFLTSYSKIICQEFGFRRFMVKAISQIAILKEWKDSFIGIINLLTTWNQQFKIKLESGPIREVIMNINY